MRRSYPGVFLLAAWIGLLAIPLSQSSGQQQGQRGLPMTAKDAWDVCLRYVQERRLEKEPMSHPCQPIGQDTTQFDADYRVAFRSDVGSVEYVYGSASYSSRGKYHYPGVSVQGSEVCKGKDVDWSVANTIPFKSMMTFAKIVPQKLNDQGFLRMLALPNIYVSKQGNRHYVPGKPTFVSSLLVQYDRGKTVRTRDGTTYQKLEVWVDARAVEDSDLPTAPDVPELSDQEAMARINETMRKLQQGKAKEVKEEADKIRDKLIQDSTGYLLAAGIMEEYHGEKIIQGSRRWEGPPDGYEAEAEGFLGTYGKCTHSFSWTFTRAPEDLSIKIIEPQADAQYVFGEKAPRQLEIVAKAKVEPADGAGEIEWEVEDIQGSRKTITPLKGKEVKITFDGLPEKNDEFGPKKITAKVRDKQGQVRQDQVTVKIFFARDERDNPEGKHPNWFYYWRQGAVDGLERFECQPGDRTSYIRGLNKFFISEHATKFLEGGPLGLLNVVRKRDGTSCTVRGKIVVAEAEGIDAVARCVAHELEHHQRYLEWLADRFDEDGDGVTDRVEKAFQEYCLDYQNPDTHELGEAARDATNDADNELLAIAAEGKESISKSRIRRHLDWACPGSQFKK